MTRVTLLEPLASYQYCHANADTQLAACGLAASAHVTLRSVKPFHETLPGIPQTERLTLLSLLKTPSRHHSYPGRNIELLNSLLLALWTRLAHLTRPSPNTILWLNGQAIPALLSQILFPRARVALMMHNAVLAPGTKVGPLFRLFWFFELRALRILARRRLLLTPSPALRHSFKNLHNIEIPPENTIPIGINARPLPAGPPPFQSHILIFGGINHRKNYPCAIRGFLRQTAFQHMTIAGTLQDETVPALIKELDPAGRIRLIPRYISEDELARLCDQSDLALQPHGHGSELASGTLSRALEFGLPIVAPDLPQFSTWLTRHPVGRLHTPDDPDSLAAVLQNIGDHFPHFQRTFRQAHAELLRETSWEATGRRYLAACAPEKNLN